MGNLNRTPTDMIEDRVTKKRLDEILAEKAQQNIASLPNKIDFVPLFAVDGENGYTRLQGMCVTDQYIVFAVITELANAETYNTYLYVVDKVTFTLVNKITTYNFNHANSLTFNPDNNTIAIVHCIAADGTGSKTVSIVDASLLSVANPSNFVKQTYTLPYKVQSGCYYKNRYYLLEGDEKTVHILDTNFVEQSQFTTLSTDVAQNMEGYNDLLFISRIAVTSWIEIYDLKGNFVKKWIVPKDILGWEIEGFNHLSNGNFVSGFNGDKHYFYLSRIYDTTSSFNTLEIPNYYKSNAGAIYVNSSYTGFVSDGSQSKPFRTLAQVTDYLNRYPQSGNVDVFINGIFNETFNISSLKFRVSVKKDPAGTTASIDNINLNYAPYIDLINLTIFGANANNQAVYILGSTTVYMQGVTIAYTRDGNINNGYTPIYMIGSRLVFDNIPSTINGAKAFVINAVSSTVHISNGLTGTNMVGIRLKASTLYYTSANFSIGNSIWQLESGGQYYSDTDNGSWQTIALQNGFTAFSGANTPKYKIKRINGEYYLYLRGAVTSQATMNGTVIIGNIPITQYLTGIPFNIEFTSLMSDNTGVTQSARWGIDLATGNLFVTSTSYGSSSIPTGKWVQLQLNGYPLVP